MGQREMPSEMPKVWILTAIVAFVWLAGGILGAFGPENVTGADPTHVPVAALIAPIAAMLLTTTACQLFRAYEKQELEDQ
jgi:hypothetical protein